MMFQAYFAVIMIQFENCSDQKSLPRNQLINMLDKWFLLAHKVCTVFTNFNVIGRGKVLSCSISPSFVSIFIFPFEIQANRK